MEKVEHPICGCLEFPDRLNASGPCDACLAEIEEEQMGRKPHPICGCLKPVWAFRTDGGPCGHCLKDVEREYGLTPDPAANRPTPTIEDFRAWRAPLLDATDWVDINPARVAREPAAYVEAIRTFRQQLLDGTQNYTPGPMPAIPDRKDY